MSAQLVNNVVVALLVLAGLVVKTTGHSDMSAQIAVQPFILSQENATNGEMYVIAVVAQLRNMKLENGQEDAVSKLIVEVSNHAAKNNAVI